MIKRIVLENWKTHKKSELDFSNGTNVLIGKMGSGKTSLIEGICFALFGTFPALQRKEISLEEIVMRKPYENEFAKVVLEFEYSGKTYSVERTISKGKASQAKLSEEGKFLAGPQVSEVTRKVSELMEIDYELFARAIYSEQNQIDYFLKLAPRERKEKFDALLGLDKYEKVRENAVKVKNKIGTLLNDRKSFLEEEKKQFSEKELGELQGKVEKIGKEKEEMREEVEEKHKFLDKMLKEFEEVERKGKEFEGLERQKIQVSTLVDSLKKELGEKKVGEKEVVEGKIKEIEGEVGELKKLVEREEGEITKFKEEIAVGKNTVFNENELIKHLDKADANCPICKEELSGEKRGGLLKEKEGLIEKLGGKEKEFEGKIKEGEKKVREAEEKKEKMEREVIDLNNELKEIQEIVGKEKELEGKETELKAVEEKLKKLDFDKESLLKKQKELEQLKERSHSLKKEIELKGELLGEIEKQVKGMLEKKEVIAELEKKIEGIKGTEEKMGLFVNSLKETQAQLRNTLIETINQAMQDLWGRIYPYRDFSSVKMVIEEGNYELKVKTVSGNWEKIEGVLSGGERSTVALTARIAFSLVLARNLSWLILDEPTHNLDRATIERVSLLMREHLPELVEQVFLITHEREMENAASASLYILNREKNEEGITKPEQMNIN